MLDGKVSNLILRKLDRISRGRDYIDKLRAYRDKEKEEMLKNKLLAQLRAAKAEKLKAQK
jgi:hypothetical protein